MAKGVKGASETFEYGMSWVTARRAILKVFADRIECGDWTIPCSEIERAVLFETKQWFIPCYILKVGTANVAYQFGLTGGKFWRGELPFPATREKGKLHYSTFSLIVRGIVVAGIICYFFLR